MKQHSGISRVLAFALAWMLCLSLALPAAAAENGDVINIKTVDDLLELSENCRLDTWSRGKNVILQADISLDGVDFQPIPSFSGTFNGCGHTISGLTLYDSVTPAGLFGTVQQGGTVKNLTVTGTVSPSGKAENLGGIVGINGGTLRNCSFTGAIKGKTSVGGIAGMNELTGRIADCKTSGSMKGEKMTGGIVGCNQGTVTGCRNNSFINTVSADKTIHPEDIDLSFVMDLSKLSSLDTQNAATDTGGIAGYSSGILGRCTNLGTIGYPHVGYNVGGVVGRSCGYLYNCSNCALVYGRKDVGGVAGQMEPFIAANMTEDTLGKLQRQLDELDALLNQAMEDAGSGMSSVTSRLNSMAGNVGGAAAGLNDIQTTATIEGSASGSSEGESGGSITVSPPQLDVEAGAGGISGGGVVITPGGGAGGSGALIEGSISGGLTEGGASGDGGAYLGGSVSASTQITMTTSLNGVASSLYGLSSQMRALSGEMAGVTGTLKADITAINEKVNEVTDTAYDLFLGDGNQAILIDSSEMDIDLITLGKIKDCKNSGEINGDINIGGIAGTMALEYELDPEDDLSSQTDDSERRKYEVKAVVQDCVNIGSITAKRSCVGGIAGRMDLGMIAHAENYGVIQSESGDYVGGIAGITSSTVRNCFSKCTLSGGSYIGGIVGSGVGKNLDGSYSNVVSCCSMVEIPEYEQFVGAISGDRAGSFLENYFISDTLAGINGRSYSGEAEPILYDELIARFQQPEPTEPEATEDTEDPQAQEETEETEPEQPAQPYPLPDEFRQFTLRFVIDEETVEKRTFHYGDSFGDSVYPEIPEKEGYYACWDLDSLENLNFDTVVTAVYSPYTTALSSRDKRENGRSVFYAEGEFLDSAELVTQRQESTPEDLDMVTTDLAEIVNNSFSGRKWYRQVLECWNLTIPEDGLDTHTLRFLPPEGKNERLAVFLRENGQWHEVDSAYIGNYLTFQTEGEAVEMALLSTVPVWWIGVLPAVLAVLLLWLLIFLIRRICRKHKLRRMQKLALQQMPPLPPKRRGRKGLLITLIVILILALIAGGCVAFYLYNPGIGDSIQAYRILQLSVGDSQLAMTLTVDAAYGDQTVQMNADIDKIQVDGKQVVVIRQGDYGLYYCDHAVYLENGTGYQLNAQFPDYSQLLDQVLALYRRMDITAENGEYVIFTSGQDAQELLQILTPTLADQISDLSGLEVRLATENERLKQVRFRSEGTLKGKDYRLDASLDILGASQAVVPEPVRSAIVNGTARITTVVTEDLISLANAWNALENKTLLCADLALSADCGPLKISEQLEFYRDTSGAQPIFSLQKNGYGLYFTDSAVCDRNGLAVSTEQAQLADSARLLDLAYELCQSADVSVSNGVYTVTLDENGMTRAACAIAPQTAEMDIAYKEGMVQLQISDGAIVSIRFSISGSVKVVVAEVPVSLTGQLAPSDTQREFTVPEAVRKALEK